MLKLKKKQQEVTDNFQINILKIKDVLTEILIQRWNVFIVVNRMF